LVVYARKASGDLAAVVVDRSDPGVELEPLVVAGVRAAGLARLKLHDVQLPATRVLIERDALSHAQRFLNQRRLLLCCAPLGRLRGLLNELVRHLSPRERYGQNVLDFSNVQARLGRMSAAVRAAEIMTRATLERVTRAEHDALWDEDIVATKYFVSEQCQRVADDCMRLLGGDSLRCGLPFERTLRDFWGLLAGAGAQDILEVGLGSSLVTRSRMEYTT
jgi:alkylation response protein AidB-like acyl-CoA dehydrogenase